jgi:hypothetical protein
MVPELRPRGVGEMLDASVALFRARFVRLILVTAVVVVPVQAFTTLVLLSAESDASFGLNLSPFSTGSTNEVDAESAAVQLGAFVVVLFVSVAATAFVLAVCTRIVADAYIDHGEATGETVRIVGRRFFAVLILSVLVAITQVAVITIVLFAVAVPILVLEGVGVFRAMGRSASLTISNFWRSLGIVVTSQVLASVVSFGLAAAVALLLRDSGEGANVIAQGVANAIASALTTPFLAAAVVVLYFDLRIRSEGFDVQLLMQRDDARVAA